MENEKQSFPQWMRGFLLVTAIYNLAWGIFVYGFTDVFVQWITMSNTADSYQVELHGVGLIVLAVVIFLTAVYPIRFWYFIFFGFLAKAFGGIWVYFSIMEKEITQNFILHLVLNDYLWAVFLIVIAIRAYKYYQTLD